MTLLTETFALALYPRWLSLDNPKAKERLNWYVRRDMFSLSFNSERSVEFKSEYDAWVYASSNYSLLFDDLLSAPDVITRGMALRAQMMLGMGELAFNSRVESMHESILEIFHATMAVLEARQVTKATAKVKRATNKPASWLDVRTRVHTAFQARPELMCVRCFPSPMEEGAWSVRLRLESQTDEGLAEIQRRHAELISVLGYRGIQVKDVENGTCLDL